MYNTEAEEKESNCSLGAHSACLELPYELTTSPVHSVNNHVKH